MGAWQHLQAVLNVSNAPEVHGDDDSACEFSLERAISYVFPPPLLYTLFAHFFTLLILGHSLRHCEHRCPRVRWQAFAGRLDGFVLVPRANFDSIQRNSQDYWRWCV